MDVEEVDGPLDFDQRAKLRAIVLHDDLPVLHLDEGMSSTNTDIGNLHICFHTTANLKLVIPQIKNMHDFGWSALNRFQDHVVIIGFVELHDREHTAAHLVLKGLLAELALQGLPEVRCDFYSFKDDLLTI